MAAPPLKARYRRSSAVSASQVGSRQVLFDADTGTSLVLNPTGSLIWQWLAEPAAPEVLIERLVATFDGLSAAQAHDDLATYLVELVEDGVIHGDDA